MCKLIINFSTYDLKSYLKTVFRRATIRLGEHTKTTEIDCTEIDGKSDCAGLVQDIPVESFIVHENYSRPSTLYDIALIRLARPADLSADNVKPICLPTTDELANAQHTQFTALGWGGHSGNSLGDEILKETLQFISNDQCDEIFKKAGKSVPIANSTLCARGERLFLCNGDGGALE